MSINKNLLEEINRFRMISSYQPGKLLNEQDEDKENAFGSDEKFEKFSPANKELVEIYMADDLNKLISEKQNEFMKQIPISLSRDFTLTINNEVKLTPVDFCELYDNENYFNNDQVYTLRACNSGQLLYQLKNEMYSVIKYDKYNKPYTDYEIGVGTGFVIKNLFNEFISKYPKYNTFFDTNNNVFLENGVSISEYVKNLINSKSIKITISPESEATLNKFGFTVESTTSYKKSKKEYDDILEKSKSKDGTTINGTFYDVFNTTNFIVPLEGNNRKEYSFLKNIFAVFKFTDLVLSIPPEFSQGDVQAIKSVPTPTPTPTPLVAPIELKLDLINAYAFDEVEKGDSSYWAENGQEQFDAFIDSYNNLKDKYANIWPAYLEFLKKNKVNIYGYASIDRKPGDLVYGGYIGCTSKPNKQSITVYNKCLSEKRSTQTVKDIVKKLPELDGILIPIGGGETDKFDGKNYTNATPLETYQNRRIYGVFPTYKTTP
jgi:hypothetical protein